MTGTPDQLLLSAARNGDASGIRQALSQGADINTRGEYGDTALNLAAQNGSVEAVDLLLKAGADVENLGGADMTPLMNSATGGHLNVVAMLLDNGARVSRDLLSSLQLKVDILEENAEAGMVNPDAASAWRQFLDYMIGVFKKQNPQNP
ncbi:MAG TPA: ankyrin repeat domain-containing protein [Blastocatellia bacterium]|nr:ankyrin repeat domain-containing protein [Blastocatellia bacterium]